MLFNSLHFLLFFPVALIVFHWIPAKLKTAWLLLCSYYFYMSWNVKYILLLVFSTVVTYFGALGMDFIKKSQAVPEGKKASARKGVLILGILLNLSVLFFFKYFDFFADSINDIAQIAGISLRLPAFDILLPVGISFYTFQAVGYFADVYREEIAAERNFLRYALFVSFFPQLVAGPIERSGNLISELREMRRPSWERMRRGFLTMLWGFFIKMVVADRIAVFVDYVYGAENSPAGAYVLTASVLFAFQIYCDFAGYSTIAIGAAQMLGIQLMQNFDTPYLSLSVREFWRRWHVSLSSWFRDYLYIPLGGNRKGTLRKYINLLFVFALSGLWHGADWSFVVWGLLNGCYQIAEDAAARIKERVCGKSEKESRLAMSAGEKILHTFRTFLLIDFAWIFFRSDSITQAIRMIKNMVYDFRPWILFDGSLYSCGLGAREFGVMLLGIFVLILSDIVFYRGVRLGEIIEMQPLWCRWIVYIAGILSIVIFGVWGSGYDAANFIYFQF